MCVVEGLGQPIVHVVEHEVVQRAGGPLLEGKTVDLCFIGHLKKMRIVSPIIKLTILGTDGNMVYLCFTDILNH